MPIDILRKTAARTVEAVCLAIGEVLQLFTSKECIRALVLTGAGRGFCSGQNLKASEAVSSENSNPDVDPMQADVASGKLLPASVSNNHR